MTATRTTAQSAAQHTPGRWIIDDFHDDVAVYDETGMVIAIVRADAAPADALPVEVTRVVESNARLIAAAPELLEALRLLVEWADGEHGDGPVGVQSMAEARTALAKAEGRDA